VDVDLIFDPEAPAAASAPPPPIMAPIVADVSLSADRLRPRVGAYMDWVMRCPWTLEEEGDLK
jgi:hypothetical protein